MAIILNENITDNVCGAVWLATLSMTYIEVKFNQNEHFYFRQSEIRKIATGICTKKVNPARLSQWCNADHPNNTYNYLRAKLDKRRLTQIGEFNNFKEYPDHLLDLNIVVFEFIRENSKVNYGELLDWYLTNYQYVPYKSGFIA